MNPLLTLKTIRDAHPCANGWQRLLTGLGYSDGNYDPERAVSLGDVAAINGAADALWCVRALNWSDLAVRRAVIRGAVLPAVKRASTHTTDTRVHRSIAYVERWCDGDDSVDLWAAQAGARAAGEAAAPQAVCAAGEAEAAQAAWITQAAAGAAEATWAVARELQRNNIIQAFPRVVL